MRGVTGWKLIVSACLAALLLSGARAEDKKPAGKPLGRESLDESIHQNLRGIIDHGANLYNQGDWNGCYRLWEGTLMNLQTLVGDRKLRSWAKTVDDAALKNLQGQLGDHPTLKAVIEKGLAEAQQTPQLHRRAFILRAVLDQVRAETNHGAAGKPDTKEETVVSPKPKTMWDRLGGEAGVTRIVDDFVNTAVKDPRVDFFRHNKVKVDAEQIAKMKREFVQQISQATGGPLKYTGPDMKKIHKDMGITNEQFDAAAADLRKALEKNKVKQEDMTKILSAVEKYRKDVVQPKKPEDKKPEDKKPVDKKPEDKKPVDKKPEDKKPIDKKPEDKKPVDKKPEDKKPVDKKPEDKKPVDKKPEDKKPVDKKPEDKKPVDKKPEDKKPIDKKPVDEKPEDKKPTDKKPVDTRPVDKKPTDKKPEDKKPAGKSSVSGKVTHNGVTLPGGVVSFVSSEKRSYSAMLDKDGTYSLANLQAGEYKVTIDTSSLRPVPAVPAPKALPGAKVPPSGKPEKDAKKYVAIPEKYAHADTTPLTCTVKKGKQEVNFNLVD